MYGTLILKKNTFFKNTDLTGYSIFLFAKSSTHFQNNFIKKKKEMNVKNV